MSGSGSAEGIALVAIQSLVERKLKYGMWRWKIGRKVRKARGRSELKTTYLW